MVSYRTLALMLLFLAVIFLALLGFHGSNREASYFGIQPQKTPLGRPALPAGLPREDPVVTLLGRSFSEIKEILGEPDDEGQSHDYGPHSYLIYRREEGGTLRFNSPLEPDKKLAVMIVLGEHQEILGVNVGMSFAEIRSTLGQPDAGPGPGLGGAYFMDYYFGQAPDQVPQAVLSFSADSPQGPTRKAFLKWETHFTPHEGGRYVCASCW